MFCQNRISDWGMPVVSRGEGGGGGGRFRARLLRLVDISLGADVSL